MTTILAVKKKNKLCIASDSLSVFGSRKEESGKHTHAEEKFFQLGKNIIGVAGHHAWDLILKTAFSKAKEIPEWQSPQEIFDFFTAAHQTFRSEYFLTPPSLSFFPFESSELQMLVVNSFGIFEMEYSRVVRQYARFSAIGTGEDYALGAMSAIYDLVDDAEQIAKIGIEAAAEFDLKTGAPFFFRSLSI